MATTVTGHLSDADMAKLATDMAKSLVVTTLFSDQKHRKPLNSSYKTHLACGFIA